MAKKSPKRLLSPPNEVSEGKTKLVRGLWNGAPYVCVCVRASTKNATSPLFLGRFWFCFVLSDRAWCGLQNFYTEFWNILIMQIYANLFKINEKCYFSISWPILILFVLSDRAWCGLQKFYTEFWNSLIMQIYAKLFKINEKCYFSISWPILILFVLSDRAWCRASKILHRILKFINYANLCKIYSKSMKKCYFSVISWPILILFVLSDRAWCGLQTSTQNFEIL